MLISIDALKPEYFLDPASHAKIPALQALMARGTFGALEGVYPTVTYPTHTTMVTGVNPSSHGILVNTPFDPLYTNQDGWNWYAADITAPTLWQAAHAKGLTVGAVYWPVTVGADIDWNLPQVWRAKNAEDDKLMRALARPRGLAEEIEAHGHALPSESRGDAVRGDSAEYVLRAYAPNLMLVYYTDLDSVQHQTGAFSDRAYATLEKIDGQVARLERAAEAIGIAADTTFVVVSDHGFADVDKVVRPAVALAKAGLINVEGGRVKDWKAGLLSAGGMCGIVLKNPDDDATRERTGALLEDLAKDKTNGIAAIDGAAEIAKMEGFRGATWVLEAEPGYFFSSSLWGDLVGPSGERGMHGYRADHADMHASIIAAGPAVTRRGNLGMAHMVDVAPTIAAL
ncbi:MAG: ectonucleotide pyrophosphatase/phosphodiesterase, partial [Polyangiaceae bacterium]